MTSNIPLTIMASIDGGVAGYSKISIGDNRLKFPGEVYDQYWGVIIDRLDLSVVSKFTFSDFSKVPEELEPYLGKTQYILILTSCRLDLTKIPTDALVDFLKTEGSGIALEKATQISDAFSGNWPEHCAYTLVAVLGDEGSRAYEGFEVFGPAMVSTLELVPITIEGKTYYTPISMN